MPPGDRIVMGRDDASEAPTTMAAKPGQSHSQSHWSLVASGGPSSVDAGEVRRALGLLMVPGECHEVRALPSGRSRLVRGDDLDAAVRAVEDLADGTGVYLTVNPVRPDLGTKAATNGDIARRRDFYVDVDPVRPRGTNATDGEHEAARVVAEAVRADLATLGWPVPLTIDSGSGWHLHYLVDLPNDKLSQQIVSKALKALAGRHNTDDVKVDPAVHNAARIARIPGTINRKGPNTAERPHRPCRLVSVPATLAVANAEMIKALAGLDAKSDRADDTPDRSGQKAHDWSRRADDGQAAYARAALQHEAGKVVSLPPGEPRNAQLYQSALKMGGYVAGGLIGEAEVVDTLTRSGKAIGLGTDGDPNEVERAIANGLAVGKTTPKRGPESRGTGKDDGNNNPSATVDAETGKRTYPFPLIIKGSAIEPKKVVWLWPDRVPIGFLTLFAGRTSVGKSFVTLDFAARVTVGEELPFCGGLCAETGNILIISEDSAQYVIAPRLIELGADMDRINVMTFEAMAHFTLSNIDMLDDLYEQSDRPSLVIIDPPTNFLGQKDEHKNAEVRGVLMGLSIWAMKYDLAVVLITHCNKGIKKDIAALDRIIGSVAWASTTRIAHILAPDPDDMSRCLFIPMKNNVGEVAKGLAYRVRKTDTLAVVDWLEPVEMTGDEAIGAMARPRRVVAAEWLVERFQERLEWPSDDLFRAGQAAGVSRNAIFEAKDSLQLPKARHDITEDGRNEWVWWVPPDWPPLQR